MKRQDIFALRGPMADILPPAFDVDVVEDFFSQGETPADAETAASDKKRAPLDLTDYEAPDSASAPGAPPLDLDEFALPDPAQNAMTGLQNAQDRAAVDLGEFATPLRVFTPEEDTTFNDPAAKPAWAGGGGGSTDDGSTTPKGKGGGKKNKDNTTDNGDTTTDPGTDTGTDTGGTDTGTDTGTETNTGSNDPNVFVSGLDTPDGYNIELDFVGTWLDSQRQAIENAAETISDFITGDVASHNGIDDILLTISKASIDGGSGAWATGGPRSLRPDSLLPSTGVITFDTADEAALDSTGLWEDLGLHEMMHALGFGTLFSGLGMVESIDGQKRFTGQNATEAYNAEFAGIASNDPLSDIGVQLDGSGAHWHDGTFTTEVLTPYLRYSGNYLSEMSIAAMEDIGYETIYESVAIA